jgi:hypothetical protein
VKQTSIFFLLLAALGAFSADPVPSPTTGFESGASAGVVFRVTLEDPSNLLGENALPFRSNLLAAADLWSRCLNGKTNIDVLVKIVPGPGRATTRCPKPTFVKKVGSNALYEPSACTKVRTGHADTSGQPDIEMTIRGDYLAEFWFDPAPRERTAPVARDRFDAVSLFLHELAHGLGFNGWIDPATGELGGEALSTYDRFVVYDQGEFYFVGLRAMKANGGPLLLSRRNNNYHHLGREGEDCPESLRTDLMNGVLFEDGRRYSISPLDLAILEDCGMVTKSVTR